MIATHSRNWPGQSQVDMKPDDLNRHVLSVVYDNPLLPEQKPPQFTDDWRLCWSLITDMIKRGYHFSEDSPAPNNDYQWQVTFSGPSWGIGSHATDPRWACCLAAIAAIENAKEA